MTHKHLVLLNILSKGFDLIHLHTLFLLQVAALQMPVQTVSQE